MKRQQKWKRFLAALLAVVMLAGNFVIHNPMTSYASVVMATKNLWKGGPAMLYQKERKYFYRFQTRNPDEKPVDVFCIAPFNHMFNGHVVDGQEYDISAFPDAVLSQADFEKLALICHWYEEKGPQNDIRYAAAQTSIWALIDRTWDVNGEAVNVAASHLTMDPGAFKAAFKDVRQYVDDNTTDPNFSSGKNPLPAWCGTSPLLAEPQNMVNNDGVYELELDISKMPQLGKLDWKFPEGEGWKKSVSGRTMTFTYSGKGEPSGTIWADVPASLRNIVPNSSKLTVYLPRLAQDQPMVSGGIRFNQLYINIGNGGLVPPTEPGAPGGPTVEIFRHQETFESNYHIDLEKFCAETGLHLEGSTFEVLEAFDHGQLGNGEDGTVSGEFMNPSPWSGFKVCRKITTDENGHASHSDYKEYEYNKTYCGGHPEPEYLEVPEAEEGNEEAAAEAEAIEAENERLRAEWEALCQLCEEETDFHSEEEGMALEMMLSDRDETYETFINLKYQYTVREIQARPGYILHGTHNDDEVVEVIATNASEGGADADIISRRNALEVMTPERTMKIMTEDPWLPGFLSLVRPDEGAADLEDVRTLVEGTPAATPADADEAGPGTEEQGPAGPGEAETASPVNALEEVEPDSYTLEKRETASPSNASYASPPNAEEGPVDGELFDDRELDGDSLEEGDVEIPGFLYQLHDRRLDGRLSYEIQQRDPIQPLTDGDDPGDEEIIVSVSLPEPVEDDVDWVEPGDPDNLSHTFQVYDHRTEGEIHINKRDLELDREDPEGSYGMTQGDATLEGAVYGLYAAKDILHPDGKTGVVFAQNELVSIATTDANGDASFKAITEISDTSAKAENLAHTWIGHPLILGSYYIKEMSRSEGYELSVTGIDLSESNRKGTGTTTLSKAGNVEVTALTSEPDNNDGTWNAFAVTNYKTEEGYDVRISGYPEGAKIYEYTQEIREETKEIITGSSYEPKRDEFGNIVYQRAEGGEFKLDREGNYIPVPDSYSAEPVYRTYGARYRLNTYPSGEAAPGDSGKWEDQQSIDAGYVAEEANGMLEQIGYKKLNAPGEAPWTVVDLSGGTNQELVTGILDWFAVHDFWDSAAVERVYEEGGTWKALVRHDYQAFKNTYAIYDAKHDSLYIRKEISLADGGKAHGFIRYGYGKFGISGSTVRVPEQSFADGLAVGDPIADAIQTNYQPLYETYQPGEYLLDENGDKIPEMELVYTCGEVTESHTEEILTEIPAAYDKETKTYQFHRTEKAPDQPVTTDYRIITKESSMEVDGAEMPYNDYLIRQGASVTAWAPAEEPDAGSYVRSQILLYPGQLQVYQDGGTRTEPVRVWERVIKQAIQVTKDIARDSYDKHNTYKVHRDPFTVLFGGYLGEGRKYVSGFHFKAYLVSDLVKAGLLEQKEDGTWDYKKLFEDESRRPEFDACAVEWDDPKRDKDGDLTTLHAVEGNGLEPYSGRSIPLPYGTYVVVEQIPKELVNKHYELDEPRQVEIPFVPEIDAEGNVQETVPSSRYLYWADMTPEELAEKYLIRFNEETDVIRAHNHDGDFEVYKYGLDRDLHREDAVCYGRSTSEDAGREDGVYYQWLYDQDGNVVDYGMTRNDVATMTGKTTAFDGKYAKALVPWSVLDPRYGEVIDDVGTIGNREPGLDKDGDFNYVAFSKTHMENTWYSSKLRIEKLDSETGENIIHDGALFKIYLASRDVQGNGPNAVAGTGNVSYITKTVTGTRTELEARGDVDGITWDETARTFRGTVTEPDYDRMELVTMLDTEGKEVGIFRAFSTEREIMKEDGTIEKEPVGYIQTYQPLGAGTYVLVEVQAPEGYQKSKPIAFEVYRDQVTYYEEGDPDKQTEAERYQYVVPLTTTEETVYEDVSRIEVKDSPSKLFIHKVEDGDRSVGDENGLDGLTGVNDKGDLLTYQIRGRKEYLEARGDVEDISWDPVNKEYYGTVTKRYDEWSEDLIAGTEEELLAQKDVKVLYDVRTGAFSGFGLRFGIPVSGAELTLYEGLQVERDGNGGYQGISVTYDPETGKVSRITASETGTHLEITTNETDTTPPYYPIWDTEEIRNPSIEVVFYDLETVDTEIDPDTGETWILDERGNRICLADPVTGMAYTYDDYGNLIVYEADEHGEKKTAQSIEIHEDGTTESIYIDIDIQEDEVGLPLYYKDGKVTYREEVWTSDGTAREISRLPFGAYILEETKVPYDQGCIQSPAMGLVLRESREEQHFYFQNAFTKTDLAKIDVTTKEEIQDAGMSLYRAKRVGDDSERGYHLEKQDIYREWISGYQYDDNGSLKLIHGGEKVGTTEPHWIDHIPVGDYILEETRVPYEWGYVQSDPVEIRVLETGEVQTFVMEDDYTSIELRKYDGKTGEVLDDEHKATLSLYRAVLDENGQPLFKTTKDIPGTQIAVYDPDSKIVTWETGSGADVSATGRLVTDEYGETRMVYDYNVSFVSPQPDIRQARYYITETGTTRFDYLPVGHYVLVEEETPKGYATAVPQLITVEEKRHLEEIQQFAMEDRPLILEVSKTDMAAGTKEVRDAHMTVYPVVDGKRSEDPAYTWISGSDGIYTEEDKADGRIPFGFSVGDLRLHRIEYIPAGDYVLVEETTPYGFLQAVEIPFTVMDTGTVQGVEMIDEIPDGILTVVKHDVDHPETLLPGATFTLSNKDTGELLETVTTGADGRAQFKPIPIGRMLDGRFAAYTYVAEEVDAPDNYMLNTGKYEFQFPYMDEKTSEIHLTYDAVDQQNQARIAKKDMEGNALAGARLKVVDKATGQVVIDEWTTSQQDYYITGIPVGEYTLVEVETPGKGYALAEPMDFTVTENMTEPVYVEMVDPSSRMEVEKVAAGSDRLLAGAKLQLWKRSETGSAAQDLLIREWTSKEDGAEVFLGLEPGTYYIHEISAPAGYQLGEDMEVVVEDTSDIQVFRYENRKRSGGGGTTDPAREWISFIKVSDTGEYLAGAEFTFYRPDGSVLAVETTDSHGRVIILKPEPGTYTFRETKAPDGYQQLERIYSFTITESREVTGDYQVVNYKIGRKVGRITAFYRSKLNGSGDASLTYPGKLPKTGEEGNDMGVSVHVILSAAAVLLLAVWLGKRRKKVFRGSMMILLIVGFSLGIVSAAYAGESYTEEKIYQTTNEKDCSSEYARTQFSEEKTMESGNFQLSDVTVEVLKEELLPGKGFLYRTPAFADDVENHIPDEVMERGGQTYRLYQYQVLDDWVQERTSEVEGTITYTEVEYTDIIPGEGEITVTDKITGESREERLPLLFYTEGNHYWSQDFSFPVKVTDYDADVFVIGDQEVPASEDLYPYREELLNSLGLSQEHYRVHYIDWVSEPYTDQGILCRDAVARGEKLVYDAEAVYGGSVTWEAAPGKSISAVYVSESDETSVNYTVRAAGTYLPQEETEENWGTMLKAWLTEHALVISFGLLLFFFFIWALWIWRKAKKEEEMEEGCD